MLQVLIATDSLVQAVANLTAGDTNLTWPTAETGCNTDGPLSDDSFSVDGGLGRDDVTIDYDQSLFSYVGCRCASGYDNIYTFDATGNLQVMTLAAKQGHAFDFLTVAIAGCHGDADILA